MTGIRTRRVVLAAALAVAIALLGSTAATPAAATGRAWPGSTITWHTALKGEVATAVRQAAASWNNAAIGIRFREQQSARGADVIVNQIPRTSTRCAGSAACADLGYRPGHRSVVSLVGRGSSVPVDNIQYSNLIAHEFGHILGLDHSSSTSALMYPYPKSQKVSPFGTCRHVAKQDLRRATRLYGGKGSLAIRTSCRSAPKAGRVSNLRAIVDSYATTLTWRPAPRAAGYTLLRSAPNGPCATTPAASTTVNSSGTTAQDFGIRVDTRYCYTVFPLSRDGFATNGGASTVWVDTAPPTVAPPTAAVQKPTTTADGWSFDISGGTEDLVVAPGVGECPAVENLFASYPDQPVIVSRWDATAGDRICIRTARQRSWFARTLTSAFVDTWFVLPELPPESPGAVPVEVDPLEAPTA